MAYLILGIFFIAAMLFIMHPLIASRRHLFYLEDIYDSGGEKKIALLTSKKQFISDSITDLEFEHRMGKLSKEDFERLHGEYEREAVEVQKSIEALKTRREIDEFIENGINARRKLK